MAVCLLAAKCGRGDAQEGWAPDGKLPSQVMVYIVSAGHRPVGTPCRSSRAATAIQSLTTPFWLSRAQGAPTSVFDGIDHYDGCIKRICVVPGNCCPDVSVPVHVPGLAGASAQAVHG